MGISEEKIQATMIAENLTYVQASRILMDRRFVESNWRRNLQTFRAVFG